MPAVLTTGDTLECVNHGAVQAVGAARLVAGGHPVLTQAGVVGQGILGCAPPGSPPPPPCTAVGSVGAGVAARLVVNGSPVLLAGLTAVPDQPHAIGPVSAGQSKLVAS